MKTTRLHDNHIKLKGRMIEFFGWEMPVEYSGIMDEHLAVRNQAGLFDVSHMGEILVSGPQALEYVQHLTPNNAARTSPEKAQYSALTTPEGTFVDDLLVYCLDETRYLLVVNAANTDKDFEWIRTHTEGFDVTVENVSDRYSQLALQGRQAADILKSLTAANLEGASPPWCRAPATPGRTGSRSTPSPRLPGSSGMPSWKKGRRAASNPSGWVRGIH